MIKNFLVFTLLLLNLIVKAQDTLVYKNASKSVVILKEISQTEVKFHKMEMPDGPMYIVSKNDIEKIIYKNGVVEVINHVGNYSGSVIVSSASPAFRKMFYSDTKMAYKSLLNLIDNYPDIKKRDELFSTALTMKRLRNNKHGTLGGTIAFGAAALGGLVVYEFADIFTQGGAGTEFILPPAIFGACAVILCATTITLDIHLRKKRKAFVNAYNNL